MILGRGLTGLGVLFLVIGILMAVKAAGDKNVVNIVLGLGVILWGAIILGKEVVSSDGD